MARRTWDELSAIPPDAMSWQVASAYNGVPSEGAITPHDPAGPPSRTPPPGPAPGAGDIPSREGTHLVRSVEGGQETKVVPFAPDVGREAWVVEGMAGWGVNHGDELHTGVRLRVRASSVTTLRMRTNPRVRIVRIDI